MFFKLSVIRRVGFLTSIKPYDLGLKLHDDMTMRISLLTSRWLKEKYQSSLQHSIDWSSQWQEHGVTATNPYLDSLIVGDPKGDIPGFLTATPPEKSKNLRGNG